MALLQSKVGKFEITGDGTSTSIAIDLQLSPVSLGSIWNAPTYESAIQNYKPPQVTSVVSLTPGVTASLPPASTVMTLTFAIAPPANVTTAIMVRIFFN